MKSKYMNYYNRVVDINISVIDVNVDILATCTDELRYKTVDTFDTIIKVEKAAKSILESCVKIKEELQEDCGNCNGVGCGECNNNGYDKGKVGK